MIAVVIAALVAACLGYTLGYRARSASTETVERLLHDEHTRTNDLLTRLAARNLSEYHAFAQYEPAPEVQREVFISDPTGLITVPAGDD